MLKNEQVLGHSGDDRIRVQGRDPVAEVRKCFEYCKKQLA